MSLLSIVYYIFFIFVLIGIIIGWREASMSHAEWYAKEKENRIKIQKIKEQPTKFIMIVGAIFWLGIGCYFLPSTENTESESVQVQQEDDYSKKINKLDSASKELYEKRYKNLLSEGKSEKEAKEIAYHEVEKYQDIIKKTELLTTDVKLFFDERYQMYLANGMSDIEAKEKALKDIETMKEEKIQAEKKLAKEKEIKRKIANFSDEEKAIFDSKYDSYVMTMDEISAREKAISDVETTIEENKKTITKEFLEKEQPFKQEKEARAFSTSIGYPKTVQTYAALMLDLAKRANEGDSNTKDVRAACAAYYSAKGAEEVAKHKAKEQDVSIEKIKDKLKSLEISDTAEKAEKEIRRLASWSKADLE